ncbi:YhdP family protein [Bordetella sp. 2513F-2]
MYKGRYINAPLPADLPVSVSTKFLRCLYWGVLAVYAAVVVGVLGLRYAVLPRIDQWRPQIERQASEVLGAQVRIGAVSADWSGLNPRLRLSTVHVYEPGQSDPVVTLPRVAAVLGWSSVLRLAPRFLSLRIEGADLDVRRDPDGTIRVAGRSLDPKAGAGGDSPWLAWLLRQRQIGLYDLTVRWHDAQRQAPELVLSNVNLLVRNGTLAHRFALSARPPAALAAGIELRGEIDRGLFAPVQAPSRWNGQLYAQVDDAEPAAWAPWLALPALEGRVAARGWLRLADGAVQDLTLDTALRGLRWRLPDGAGSVAVATARARLEGEPGDLLQRRGLPLRGGDAAHGLRLAGEAAGLQVGLPHLFETPELVVDALTLDGRLRRPQGQAATLDLRQLHLSNADLDLRLYGAWRGEGRTAAGTADLRGTLSRASMPAIHRYLPAVVSPMARRWLAQGLQAGEARDAALTLKGDLADFPYTQGRQGEFRVSGAYDDGVVDYAPARPGRQGWPRLQGLSGSFVVDKTALALTSAGGYIETGAQQRIDLGPLQATIPDMEHDAQLTVDGDSSGDVSAYLALVRNSPLGRMLHGALSDAQGSGQWRVPLKLQIPLMRVRDARVDGRIAFQDNRFRFSDGMPSLSRLSGTLAFSETGLQAQDIQGVFLGGPARISGRLDGSGQALQFSGTLPASGLQELARTPLLERFSGKTSYEGSLSYGRGKALSVTVRSPLTGLAVDLPAPLGKPAGTERPLHLEWEPASDAGTPGRRWLSGGLGTDVNLLLEHDPDDRAGTFFSRGALGAGRAATLPLRGMRIAGSVAAFDLDAWERVADGVAAADEQEGKRPAGAEGSVLPRLDEISLDTEALTVAGHRFDAVKLQARRPTPTQWRVQLDARQAAGTLEWTEAAGTVAGKVVARLSRLAIGAEEDDARQAAAQAVDQAGEGFSDIPAIDLQAQSFNLYGHELGRLELLGTNLERGGLWRLDKLTLGNDAATLQATGTWKLKGADRGLTVDASADFRDLGAYLEDMGLGQVVSGGSGTVRGKLSWRDLPWRRDLTELQGHARVSLDKGRFVHVNSRTARLLELLSLQSLQRLARLEMDPAGVLREGFPFDTVRGDVSVSKGVVSTDGYKINGPVAAIVLGGTSDIVAERWDLQAVVIPNLDASGAAVATALAVNPLIGLGAFLTQWLLKQPLARAMTMEYTVTGSWDDPKLAPVEPQSTPMPKSVEEHIEH